MSPQPPHQSSHERAAGQSGGHHSWQDPSVTDFVGPSRTGLVVVLAALVSAGTMVALHFGLHGAAGGADGVAVPEVVGMTQAQARIAAQGVGLSLQVMGTASDPFVAEGAVAKQVPLAGEKALHGSTLAVTLSRGPGAVTLPLLAGMAVTRAVERLVGLGLRTGGTRYEARDGVPDEQVVATDPPAGASLKPGARVNLVICRGSTTADAASRRPQPRPATGPLVSVPKVVGVRLPFAAGRLRSQGLGVGRVSYLTDEDHIDGYVLRQSPLPGARVPAGSSVDLTVNRTE